MRELKVNNEVRLKVNMKLVKRLTLTSFSLQTLTATMKTSSKFQKLVK